MHRTLSQAESREARWHDVVSTYARSKIIKKRRDSAGKTEKHERTRFDFLGAQKRSNARTEQNYCSSYCCSNASTATKLAADLFSFSFSGEGIIAAATAAAATAAAATEQQLLLLLLASRKQRTEPRAPTAVYDTPKIVE